MLIIQLEDAVVSGLSLFHAVKIQFVKNPFVKIPFVKFSFIQK